MVRPQGYGPTLFPLQVLSVPRYRLPFEQMFSVSWYRLLTRGVFCYHPTQKGDSGTSPETSSRIPIPSRILAPPKEFTGLDPETVDGRSGFSSAKAGWFRQMDQNEYDRLVLSVY